MTRALGLLAMTAAAAAVLPGRAAPHVVPQAPLLAPQVQNGRVEHRPVTDIARDLVALGNGEAVWVGWTVPMADGPRDLCNWYSTSDSAVRGFFAEPSIDDGPRTIAPATGPVPLEAGNGLVVLARMARGKLNRLRTLGDDCPIDAGGRTVYWLDGVTPAASLAWLDAMTAVPSPTDTDRLTIDEARTMANAAVSAIGLHASVDADRMLERLASSPDVRRRAATTLATSRGASGFAALERLLASATDPAARRTLVSALGQTREPGTPDTLLRIARADADARARADAVFAYARIAGPKAAETVVDIIEREEVPVVRRRAIAGLAAMPNDTGLPYLIDLARTSTDMDLKREAVSAVSRSDDPRARALLTEIIKG